MSATKTYTLEQLAAVWQCSYPAVYRLIKSGKLAGFKAGREWRVTDTAKENFEQTSATDEPKAPSRGAEILRQI